MRRTLPLAILAALLLAAPAAGAAAAAEPAVKVTPIGRLPFPERGYIVDLPTSTSINATAVRVTENGQPVENFAFTPVAASGIRYGVILAVDTSESMAGDAIDAAVGAARSFVANAGDNQWIGLVTFNGSVRVDVAPTLRSAPLDASLARTPTLAYGTRIFDATDRALTLLGQNQIAAGAVVVLSDGADVGSRISLAEVVSRAKAQRVRVFTIGLRSGAFDETALRELSESTGGTYVETAQVARLSAIYSSLSRRLAREYLVQYRSLAPPKSNVDVAITIPGFERVEHEYTAPTPSALAPYHRSLLSRFLLSPLSLLVLSLLGALLVAILVASVVDHGRSRLVDRIAQFLGTPAPAPPESRRARVARARAAGRQRAQGWLAKLDQDLDIADIQISASRVAVWTLLATVAATATLALISPALGLAGLLTPLVARGLIKRRVAKVRDEFADQLPPNLQVLASALRAGHSFAGALAVTLDNAHDPMQRELRRAVTDEQLGVPMDEAVRRVAERMKSRDLEQVALLAELQRTTGGNAAEVLDVVVGTVRERADIRRLVRTLTAQGRMARWILTALPIVVGFFGFMMQPDVMKPFLASSSGQLALLFAGILVVAGSLMIQRIVDIEV
jgi:tight adherence protein B